MVASYRYKKKSSWFIPKLQKSASKWYEMSKKVLQMIVVNILLVVNDKICKTSSTEKKISKRVYTQSCHHQ